MDVSTHEERATGVAAVPKPVLVEPHMWCSTDLRTVYARVYRRCHTRYRPRVVLTFHHLTAERAHVGTELTALAGDGHVPLVTGVLANK